MAPSGMYISPTVRWPAISAARGASPQQSAAPNAACTRCCTVRVPKPRQRRSCPYLTCVRQPYQNTGAAGAPATVAAPGKAAAAATAITGSSSGWQTPFVNVFKLCGVESASAPVPAPGTTPAPPAAPSSAAPPGAAQQPAAAAGGPPKPPPPKSAPPGNMGHEKSGRVLERMDAEIGKRVLRITGTIPAVNYLKLPKGKSLGLTGRFCYLQVGGSNLLASHHKAPPLSTSPDRIKRQPPPHTHTNATTRSSLSRRRCSTYISTWPPRTATACG
jgi:hypothetical protein